MISKLNLGGERCPVVMQKITLALKTFATNPDLSHLLITTVEHTVVRDLTALLDLKYPELQITQTQQLAGGENAILVGPKAI